MSGPISTLFPEGEVLPESEALLLPSGYRARIRRITAQSRPLIAAAMLRLSPESSRRRFFTPRFRLSERELDHLTSPDGVHHVALGVCGHAADGTLEGIAAARFIRDADDASTAEFALMVIDAFQHQGIGRTLFARLVAAGRRLGVRRLRGLLVPDNVQMLGLLRTFAPAARYAYDGEILTAVVDLDRVAWPRLALA